MAKYEIKANEAVVLAKAADGQAKELKEAAISATRALIRGGQSQGTSIEIYYALAESRYYDGIRDAITGLLTKTGPESLRLSSLKNRITQEIGGQTANG